MTETPDFLRPLEEVAGVRAGWVGRIPGLAISGGRDEAMRALRPHHEAAVAAFGGPRARGWWRAEQVHGVDVIAVPGASRSLAPDGLPVVPGADGLVTDRPGLVLVVYVADCGPIWLADRKSGAIGLLHSGKKGTEGNILAAGLDCMAENYGTDPADVVAVLGPCIRPPNYEVDFAAKIGRQARELGLGRFRDCGADTALDLGIHYSYRMERGVTGRMMAMITRDFPA